MSEFNRACTILSAMVMSERLRKMVEFDILDQIVQDEKPHICVEYSLTPFGQQFIKVIDEIRHLQDYIDEKQ